MPALIVFFVIVGFNLEIVGSELGGVSLGALAEYTALVFLFFNKKLLVRPVILGLLLLSIWIMLTEIFNMSQSRTSILMLSHVITVMYITSYNEKVAPTLVLSFFMLSGLMTIPFVISSYYLNQDMLHFRSSFLGENPNVSAMRIVYVNVINLFYYKRLTLPVFILSLITIFLTGSRSALISLVLVFFVWVILNRKVLKRWLLLSILFAASFIGNGYTYILSFLTNTALYERSVNKKGILEDTRYGLWKNGISNISENPIFGCGFDLLSDYGQFRDPHNAFLAIGQASGLIGLVLFIIVIGALTFNLRNISNRLGYLMLILVFLIDLFQAGGVFTNRRIYLIIIILIYLKHENTLYFRSISKSKA